jgi:hypothetical protein
MKKLKGFFELELESDGIAFLVTVQIMPPGIEESEAKAKVVEEWILHFAIAAPISVGAVECLKMRPLPAKPEDGLKVPKGTVPVLIWKSVEK